MNGTMSTNSTAIAGPNYYISLDNQIVHTVSESVYENSVASFSISSKSGFAPQLAFKFIKKKFGLLEGMTIERRLKKLEKAALQAIDNGQEFLANKFMTELARETRESVLYAKGYSTFVERNDVMKVKHKIRGGHISDTKYKDYTRIIPKDIIAKKKKAEPYFDDFIIYHYYDKEIEKKLEKSQKMDASEVARMKDPILFGIIKETDRLYFIGDWEDEYCELTFDEIIDVVGENKLTKYPTLQL